MRIENGFLVTAPTQEVWEYLLDVERIAPCMPGAEITEHVDERNWNGKVNLKFGPVAMSFAGSVEMTERDDEAHRVVLAAKGTEQKGKGAAHANVTSWLEPGGDGDHTLVKMEADITLTGAAAQLSRGLLPEISRKLTQQFADCLQADIDAASAAAHPAPTAGDEGPLERPAAAAEPVGALGLGLSALWATIVGFFKRLFGGGKRDA
jgi:carbon monoxide dehydrogenase subunit G